MTILTIPPHTKDLGNDHYIGYDAELDTVSLQARCDVHETCTNKIAGFTGGVQLFYYGNDRRLISSSQVHQYGLSQAPLIGASHRNEGFDETAPSGTAGFAVAAFWDPKDRFGEFSAAIGQFFTDVGHAIDNAFGLSDRWCLQNQTWCTVISFAVVFGGGAAVVLLG
jgi:hypothetical protein